MKKVKILKLFALIFKLCSDRKQSQLLSHRPLQEFQQRLHTYGVLAAEVAATISYFLARNFQTLSPEIVWMDGDCHVRVLNTHLLSEDSPDPMDYVAPKSTGRLQIQLVIGGLLVN